MALAAFEKIEKASSELCIKYRLYWNSMKQNKFAKQLFVQITPPHDKFKKNLYSTFRDYRSGQIDTNSPLCINFMHFVKVCNKKPYQGVICSGYLQ
jgi:hypothetical protein